MPTFPRRRAVLGLCLVLLLGAQLAVSGAAVAKGPGAQPRVDTWSPRDSTSFNYPLSPHKQDRYRIRNVIRHSIQYSPTGAMIRLSTFTFVDDSITDDLIAAVRRGVSVQVLVNADNAHRSEPLRRFKKSLKTYRRYHPVHPVSYLVTCDHACRGRFGNLHSKIYLFSHVANVRWVSMVGSANLTDFAAVGQWNHLDTLVGRQDYTKLAAVFDAMRRDTPQPFVHFRTPKTQAWVFPKMGTRPSTDPMVRQLSRIGCVVPATAGQPAQRTRIRISMYAWFQVRGDYLARAVRAKWNQGCNIKIIYSIMNRASMTTLRDPHGRGPIPLRRSVTMSSIGDIVDYSHSKYVAVDGMFNGHRHQMVWTGSMNFTMLGIRSDDIIVRLLGERVWRAYFVNFYRVWRAPTTT